MFWNHSFFSPSFISLSIDFYMSVAFLRLEGHIDMPKGASGVMGIADSVLFSARTGSELRMIGMQSFGDSLPSSARDKAVCGFLS
jgi:hypothetical protein